MKKGVLKNGRAMVWGFIDGVAANGCVYETFGISKLFPINL